MAQPETFHKQSNHAGRTCAIGQVCRNVRMGEIERVVRAEAIAFFGHGQSHKLKIRRPERIAPCIVFHRGDLCHGPDDTVADLFIKNGECVEIVLRPDRITQGRAFHRDAMDAPARIAREQAVKIVRLVSAVECARADVKHAGANARPVIGGHANVL